MLFVVSEGWNYALLYAYISLYATTTNYYGFVRWEFMMFQCMIRLGFVCWGFKWLVVHLIKFQLYRCAIFVFKSFQKAHTQK